MNTLIGVKWPEPTWLQIKVLLVIIFLIIVVFAVIRLVQILQQKKQFSVQSFLFHARQKGLNTFELKVVQEMAHLSGEAQLQEFLRSEELFVQGVARLLHFGNRNQSKLELAFTGKTLVMIAEAAAIAHEKLFQGQIFNSPLQNIEDLPRNALAVIFPAQGNPVYAGYITGAESGNLQLSAVLRSRSQIDLLVGTAITIRVWRRGDKKYEFLGNLLQVRENSVAIQIAEMDQGLGIAESVKSMQVRFYLPKAFVVYQENEKNHFIKAKLLELHQDRVVLEADHQIPVHDHIFLYLISSELRLHIPMIEIEEVSALEIAKGSRRYRGLYQLSELSATVLQTFFRV